MNKEPLCKTCNEKDTAFVYRGHHYVQELICLYDMANFPRMFKCVKYQPKEPSYEPESH